jgi:hypothetical protein
MAERLPQERHLPIPFSREEYVRAHQQVISPEEAEVRARAVYDGDPSEVIGVHVMDGDLLLLAILSEELASRVLAYRPKLSELVDRVRADPEGFLEGWRGALEREP